MSDESSPELVERFGRSKTAICVLCLCAVPVAFVIGVIFGEFQSYMRRASKQEKRMVEFFAEYPGRFGTLEVAPASSGFAYPFGEVQSQEDYDFLDENLQRMFGDELGKRMMSAGVSVAER